MIHDLVLLVREYFSTHAKREYANLYEEMLEEKRKKERAAEEKERAEMKKRAEEIEKNLQDEIAWKKNAREKIEKKKRIMKKRDQKGVGVEESVSCFCRCRSIFPSFSKHSNQIGIYLGAQFRRARDDARFHSPFFPSR